MEFCVQIELKWMKNFEKGNVFEGPKTRTWRAVEG
jgi:hypothetical protein